jgi:hypothetical protein
MKSSPLLECHKSYLWTDFPQLTKLKAWQKRQTDDLAACMLPKGMLFVVCSWVHTLCAVSHSFLLVAMPKDMW